MQNIYNPYLQGMNFDGASTFAECLSIGRSIQANDIQDLDDPFYLSFEQKWGLNNYYKGMQTKKNAEYMRSIF